MNEDAALAVFIRQTQWILDDAAHDLPAGRYPASRRLELADVLESVATLLRGRPDGMVIDAAGPDNPGATS